MFYVCLSVEMQVVCVSTYRNVCVRELMYVGVCVLAWGPDTIRAFGRVLSGHMSSSDVCGHTSDFRKAKSQSGAEVRGTLSHAPDDLISNTQQSHANNP